MIIMIINSGTRLYASAVLLFGLLAYMLQSITFLGYIRVCVFFSISVYVLCTDGNKLCCVLS